MNNYRSLNHTKWECQYHVVFIPKYRRKAMYGGLRHHLGDVLRRLAEQRESRVEEGHLLADHVHMMVSIPPKYSVAQVIGYIKGKSAIHIAREFAGRPRNFVGQHFWARGYYVSPQGFLGHLIAREYSQCRNGGSQIKVRRRRREPGGRPETGTAVGDGCRPGASARRCCVCCAARILVRVAG